MAKAQRDEQRVRPELRLVRAAPREESDDALLRAWRAGDEDAFAELVRRHERVALRLLARYAGADEARDLAQRAFLKAVVAARRAEFWARFGAAPVPFRSWLLRVCLNLARNRARDVRRWPAAPEGEAERVPLAPVGTAALEAAERARAVRAAVLALPRRQREVVTLRVDGELPFAEIAEVLGTTENSVKVTFHQASRRLREALRGGGL